MFSVEKFDGFDVYKSKNKNIFIRIGNLDFKKYDGFFDWAFTDEMLLRYMDFDDNCLPEDLDDYKRIAILKALRRFIDETNIGMMPYDKKYDNIYEILKDEDLLVLDGKDIKVRKDKIGKIGEFIFYNILSDYFHFNCIYNKIQMSTSLNMSVFGMDQLFYSYKDNLLMFGESKFCNNIDNGIALINESLGEYKDRLEQEFVLVLSNEAIRDKMDLPEELKNATRKSLTFNDFIKLTGVTCIGIPIFIMHGVDEDINSIMNKLDKIKTISIQGLNINYIFISVPIKSKEQFVARITRRIDERMQEYGK